MPFIPNIPLRFLSITIASLLFVGCGGGGGDSSSPEQNTTTEASIKETLTEPETIEEANTPIQVEKEDKLDVTDVPVSVAGDSLIPEKEVFKRLNERRTACGFGGLKVSKSLTASANNHANYLLHAAQYTNDPFSGHSEVQSTNNPYFTGVGLGERVNTKATTIGKDATAVSYNYRFLDESLSFMLLQYGDNVAENQKYTDTFMALNAINGLLAAPYHLASLVSPSFNQIGISYGSGPTGTAKQQSSVLEMVLGRPLADAGDYVPPKEVLSYPCEGIEETAYELANESPNPFGNTRDLSKNPIGQPIYILGNGDVQVTNYKLTDAANGSVDLLELNAKTDPNHRLKSNQVFLIPLSTLAPNQWYRVSYDVSVDGGAIENKTFRFKTKPKS